MNVITVRGGNSEQKALAKKAVQFAMAELLPKHRTLDIMIQFKNLGRSYHGFCTWDDCNIRPRQFTIEVSTKQSKKDMLETIMHEMVHVKQYVRGELQERYKDGHVQLWKGRDHTDTEYEYQPWEKEATKMQFKLASKFSK